MSRPWSSSVSKEIQGKEILIPEWRNAALVAAMAAFVQAPAPDAPFIGATDAAASEEAVQLAAAEEDATAGGALSQREPPRWKLTIPAPHLGHCSTASVIVVPHFPRAPGRALLVSRPRAADFRWAKSSQANTAIVAVFALGLACLLP